MERARDGGRERAIITTGGTREPVDDVRFITNFATGKFGYEIARQMVAHGYNVTVLCPREVPALAGLELPGVKHVNFTNAKSLQQALLGQEAPDIIFHAAAYKHVYLMEDNIDEAILNNIVGTRNVIDVAIKNNVPQFTFISTDKVVNPTSIMGATKKLCEFYIKCLDSKKTKFNIVRFGNVINSNGSVLPLFERQIEKYKYVTVTHKDIMRFFMSIREAAQLVIESTANGGKNSIHVLNMGELIKIHEIAECLIRSKNLLPGEDIDIKITGLRKGEKMIEELYTGKEKTNLVKTKIKNVLTLRNLEKCDFNINKVFEDLEKISSGFSTSVRDEIKIYLKKIFISLKIK
ncbi:MAG: hypothetical protein US99_C0042G0004 [Candidatus Daviesbacteria bacterium GW2011_GWF2_38_6]|uniref:Polysaccharide biosynthesis protein CapD-like domain-containing protein n=1 Tax=Candidatus Daviesbacteria bacterium GW2011_GWF2_38_6 TaxID=1618432 RepID=A0A0G0NJQ4_9BACT|nr:MAG: hypothetical protein US99_C0042G0004 [Candidatus Daviesbacteria bacterium GW2011_GWF2_38_6]